MPSPSHAAQGAFVFFYHSLPQGVQVYPKATSFIGEEVESPWQGGGGVPVPGGADGRKGETVLEGNSKAGGAGVVPRWTSCFVQSLLLYTQSV